MCTLPSCRGGKRHGVSEGGWGGYRLYFLIISFTLQLSGQAVATRVFPSLPPVLAFVFIAQRVERPPLLVKFHRILPTHALALFATRKYIFSIFSCFRVFGNPPGFEPRLSYATQLYSRLTTRLTGRSVLAVERPLKKRVFICIAKPCRGVQK